MLSTVCRPLRRARGRSRPGCAQWGGGDRGLRVLGLGILLAGSAAAQDFTLEGSRFEIGERAQVVIEGEPTTEFGLIFDVATGDFTLPGGAWIGLALSPQMLTLHHGRLPDSGHVTLESDLADDPALIGEAFYLQAIGRAPSRRVWITTNRLDVVLGDGEAGEITGAHPDVSTILGDAALDRADADA